MRGPLFPFTLVDPAVLYGTVGYALGRLNPARDAAGSSLRRLHLQSEQVGGAIAGTPRFAGQRAHHSPHRTVK
jgi:hypothetical protein